MSAKTAIIIGAGYGGMATANLLAKAGYTVAIYEKNSHAGGRINAVKQNGYTFDIGPSWYLMPEIFEHYYELFGKSAQQRLDLIRFEPGYKVFFEHNDPLVINGNVSRDKVTFEAIEPGAGAALERYTAISSQTYHLSVQYFLYNNFQALRDILRWPIIKNIPRMLGMVFRNLDTYVSSYFRDQRLKQLLEYHMVFLGSSPFQAPAIYNLMSHLDYVSGVYYPRRGMLSVASDMQALGSELGVHYHFNQAVASIAVTDGRATGIILDDGTHLPADIVISNADLHHTETKLITPPYQSFPESYWAKRQPGPSALLVSVGVTGSLPTIQHHNLFFVDDWRGNFAAIYESKTIPEHASIYVCNPTKTDTSLAPRGHENLFFLIPLPSGVTLSEQQQIELTHTAIQSFASAAGIPDLSERIVEQSIFGPTDFMHHYNAWQYNAFGGESHLLRQSIVFRTPNQSRKVKNLYYVGAGTLPGIGLPMCLISAELTYKKIVGNRSAGPLTQGDF